MTELRIKQLRVEAGGQARVDGVSFAVGAGEVVALIGPNGAGKSLTLRGALGLIPGTGTVMVGGEALADLSVTERARRIAYLPQQADAAWPVRVRDVVALGRFAHGAAASRLSGEDAEAVQAALTECDLLDLADRAVDTLSGGETARFHLARAFAARTPWLVADEPVAALDPAQAFRVMDLIRAKAAQGLGVLVVLHDIALAARYADRIVMMKDGHILADGETEAVLTSERLAELYGVRAIVTGRQVLMDGAI